MTVAALRSLPALATTGVGSLPFADPSTAIAHISGAYELPFCPQLPRRDGDMLQEWLGSDPGHCGWSPDRDRERPAAWSTFVHRLQDAPPAHGVVKLQVTGPVTLASAMERTAGRRGLGPEARALAAEIAVWLAASAADQARELDALGLSTTLIADESGLSAAGLNAGHTAIWDPLRATVAAWGLHVCGAVPWTLIDAIEPDALSFDLTRTAMQPDSRQALARLTDRGGRIIWGILDPVRPGGVEAAAARLIAASIAVGREPQPTRIAAASLVSPACGSGRLSVDGELVLAALLGTAAEVVRDGLAVAAASRSAQHWERRHSAEPAATLTPPVWPHEAVIGGTWPLGSPPVGAVNAAICRVAVLTLATKTDRSSPSYAQSANRL